MDKITQNGIDIISPIALGGAFENVSTVVDSIVWQHENYGINKFMVSAPSKGWRSIGYPDPEHFKECAGAIRKIRIATEKYGIEIGWWIILTLKSGNFSDESAMVDISGKKHAFANCPLCASFADRFVKDVATVADIAKPAFMITEDDFSLDAAKGCFCQRHLDAFGEKMGRYYSREELKQIFSEKDKQSLEIIRAWRELSRDSLGDFAKKIRKEVDKKTPNIPIGLMQSGGADKDGDSTEVLARSLAGNLHTPFVRFHGTYYSNGFSTKKIPETLYHAVYGKQHTGDSENFKFYHESDTFPSTRYFTSGAQMRGLMSAIYSYGYDGSTFQTAQSNDDPTEEKAYGRMLLNQQNRFNALRQVTKKCKNTGALISYDPFYNSLDNTLSKKNPLWAYPIGCFGIPYVTDESDTAFWDVRQSRYCTDEEIRMRLSKNLILDGDAAHELCQRGFEEFLGVKVSGDVISGSSLANDLGAREVVTKEFWEEGKGIKMPAANAYSPVGNGIQRKIEIIDPECRVVTELCNTQNEAICPAMTYFENSLGGKVCVMGMTLDKNNSQALFNYRRMRLIQRIVRMNDDSIAMVREAPDVFLVQNTATDKEGSLLGMLSIINLCEDSLDGTCISLPKKWVGSKVSLMDEHGSWKCVNTTAEGEDIAVNIPVDYLSPLFLLFEKN